MKILLHKTHKCLKNSGCQLFFTCSYLLFKFQSIAKCYHDFIMTQTHSNYNGSYSVFAYKMYPMNKPECNFLRYSKALRYPDFGPKAMSLAQKTVYLEVI